MPRDLIAKPLRVAVLIQDRYGQVMSSSPTAENISEDSIAGVLAKSERLIVVNAERAAQIRRFRGRDLSHEGRAQEFLTEIDVDIIITGTAWYSKVQGVKGLGSLSIWSVVATLSVITADSSRVLDGQQFSEVGKGHWDGHALSRAAARLGAKVAAAVEASAGRALLDAPTRRVLLEVKTQSSWTPAMTRELQALIKELPGVRELSVHMQGTGLLVMYIRHDSVFERLSAELEELSMALKHVGSSGGRISLRHVHTPGNRKIAPPVSLRISPRRPALYSAWARYYERVPFAELVVSNRSAAMVEVVAVSLACGDRPSLTSAKVTTKVPPSRDATLPLRLSNSLGTLPDGEQTEDWSCRIEVRLKVGPRVLRRALRSVIAVHGRNVMSWMVGRGRGIAAFVTPDTPGVKRSVEDLVAGTSLTSTSSAMMRFAAAFGAACALAKPTRSPPNSPATVMTVQTPDQTLLRRSGSSYDVAVLLASMLEGLAVPVALVRTSHDLLVAARIRWPLEAGLRPGASFQHDRALYAAVRIQGSDCMFPKARRDAGAPLRAASAGARLVDVRAAWARGFQHGQEATGERPKMLASTAYDGARRALTTFRRNHQVRVSRLRGRSLGDDPAAMKYRAAVELALLGDRKGAMRALARLDRSAKVTTARGNVAYLAGDAEAAMRWYAEALRQDRDSLNAIWNAAYVGYDLFKEQGTSKDELDRLLARLFRADPEAESALLEEVRAAMDGTGGLRAVASRVLRWGL